jgi:hypothetical protein
MKINKRSREVILLVVLLASLIALLAQVDSIRATFNNLHAFNVYVRVETEIMQEAPAGQYYEALFWKHNDELMQIMRAHPEHNEIFLNAMLLFVPKLDALLNGNGDKAFITSEHVESFKSELDWFASMGSQSLRDDIEREQRRLPLDVMVGMSMNDALDFINSSWTPEPMEEKSLVPDSNGKWAYYVHNGVYIEYPGNYSMQISESENGYIYFIPFQGSPASWNPCVMKVRIWNIPTNEKDANDPRAWYRPENIVWDNAIQNPQFPGVEFASHMPDSQMANFHAYQYDEENQIAVDIWVFVFQDSELSDSTDYSELIARRYEYFQHMVENLRIQ